MSVIIESGVVSNGEFGSTFPKVDFNASIVVTELLAKTLENCAKELASRCIRECALKYGFDASEEIRSLGLENLSLIKKQMAKKSSVKKPKEVKAKKSVSILPFTSSSVDLSKCNGLAYNRGLFTQCSKEQMANSNFCKGCQAECDGSATGIPCCGTVQQRLSSGLYDFKDPKGRSPISYLKFLEKAKISMDAALEEAGKLNIEIDGDHFAVVAKPEKTKKESVARGRPKKPVGAVESNNVTDLFAKLTCGSGEAEVIDEVDAVAPKSKKSKLTDEEKAIKKAALEAEREAKKIEREAKQAQDKEEREEKRKAEAEQKKAERDAKVAQEKAEREAKRVQEKEERDAKKALEKAAKESEKAAKTGKGKKSDSKVVVVAPVVATVAPTVAPVVVPVVAVETTKVSATVVVIEGKKYYKSRENLLYTFPDKEEVGIWDPVTKTIKNLPEDESDSEEEDSEYEEDEV